MVSDLRQEVKQAGAEFFNDNWVLLLCIFGIIGGFAGGLISEKFFKSRRGPPAALLRSFMFMMTTVMAMTLFSCPCWSQSPRCSSSWR